jgi:cytochrome c-type biogenesis protein CcmH
MLRMLNKLSLIFIVFWVSPALAFMADTQLLDAGKEQRAQALFKEIRCMVCEGQTIADSNAGVAGDMRRSIREQITSNLSDEEIKSDLAERYGDMVLMKPPFKPATALLWFGPWLILLAGGIAAYFYFRGNKPEKNL